MATHCSPVGTLAVNRWAMPYDFDQHATTPCDPEVIEAMAPFWRERSGNPSSRSHRRGFDAREAVEAARAEVAALFDAKPKSVVFTSGATEANNLAILGAVRARRPRGHVLTAATEHPAVLDPVAALGRQGANVEVLPVDPDGRVTVDQVVQALRPDSVLVSLMAVNNEIGVHHPLESIAEQLRARGVLLHVDAAQSAYRPMQMFADLISVSGHKLYGPKGVGALLIRDGRPKVELEPLVYGGGQERGLRSGTLPVPLIVGFGAACRLLLARRDADGARLRALRDHLWSRVQSAGGVSLNGGWDRAPHNLNLSFEGVEAEALLLGLRDVVALSTGSACSSATLGRSHVLAALGLPPERIASSVRIGLGRDADMAAVDAVADAMIAKVLAIRSEVADPRS